jgi:hypothetical protein
MNCGLNRVAKVRLLDAAKVARRRNPSRQADPSRVTAENHRERTTKRGLHPIRPVARTMAANPARSERGQRPAPAASGLELLRLRNLDAKYTCRGAYL